MLNDSNENLNHTAALRAMADGTDLDAPEKSPKSSADDLASALDGLATAPMEEDSVVDAVPLEAPPTNPMDEPVAPAGESVAYALADDDEPTGPPPLMGATRRSPSATAARAQQVARQQRQHASIQFRKIAIPLLLIMGVVLFAVACGTLAIKAKANPETLASNRFLQHGNFFAILSFVLGVILVGGAGLFWYEVQKHNNRDR